MSTGLWMLALSSCRGSGCRAALNPSSNDTEGAPSAPPMAQLSVSPSLCAPSANESSIDVGDAGDRIVFTDSTFEELYPYFLWRRIPDSRKAALWLRCSDRWVRWSGRIVSFTAQGVTFKQLYQTMTFDVSVIIDMPGRAQLKSDYRLGDHVTYIGRLDHYDDIFHTMYLVHGQIVKKDPIQDLGVSPSMN